MEEGLKSNIKQGLTWIFVSQVVNQVFFVWFAIYLARILPPSTFGLVGLITVLTNYAGYFLDLGFGTALIQRKDLDKEHLSTIFWFNLFLGITLTALFYFGAPFIATFYAEPQLSDVAKVVSISFVIAGFSVVQSNLLDKQLEFKKKVILNWISNLSGYAVGIILAINEYGVWALVAQLLTTLAVNTILLWCTSSWYPTFLFSFSKLKELLPFGLNVFGDTSINYWSRNADNFLIGKFIGTEGLGLYSRAYSLMLLPIRNVSSIIGRVLFPVFSSIQEQLPVLRSVYLKAVRYIAYITFPAMAGLVVVAREFVLVCFGENWAAMIPILQWLAILGAVQSILNLNGMIYNTIGKPHIAFRVSLALNVILLISFVIGLKMGGLMGITIAYFIVGTVFSIPMYWLAIKQISISLSQVGNVIRGATLGSVVMTGAVLVYKRLLVDQSDLFILLTSIGLGAAIYVVVLLLVDKEFKMLIAEVSQKWR